VAEKEKVKGKKLTLVEMSKEMAKGVYANWMRVGHTKEEFCFDFATVYGGHGIVTARVFVTPSLLKRMVGVLEKNLKKYEVELGIKVKEGVEPKVEMGFTPN